jgi:flagellar protein FliO/FliZ
LYLGGEKLKPFRFFAVVYFATIFGFLLHAQTPDASLPGGETQVRTDASSAETGAPPEAPSQAVDENFLLLDEALPEGNAVSGPSSFFLILRMVLVLVLVAAAVYGLVYFFRRLGRPAPERDPYLKLLSSVHLGSNRYVHVVALGAKAYLIGAGDSGVSLIGEVEDQEIVDTMLLDEGRRALEGGGRLLDFTRLLQRFRQPKDDAAALPGADAMRKRRERFRGL